MALSGQMGQADEGREPERAELIGFLPFGFWCSLLGRDEEAPAPRRSARLKLWDEALCHAFPGLEGRDEAGVTEGLSILGRLHWMRNRIAHGAPLLSADPVEAHWGILRLAGLMDPVLPEFLARVSRVPEAAALDPRDLRAQAPLGEEG